MFSLSDLDPAYEYLPLVAQEEKRKVGNIEEIVVHYMKTYPAFPWKMNGKDHHDDDPRIFIDFCEEKGLVHWENKEQKEERLRKCSTQ